MCVQIDLFASGVVAIVFVSDPSAHVKTIRAFFEQRKVNLKLSLPSARLRATGADISGPLYFARRRALARRKIAGFDPYAHASGPEIASLSFGWPDALSQVLRDVHKHIRPVTSFIAKGVKFMATPSM